MRTLTLINMLSKITNWLQSEKATDRMKLIAEIDGKEIPVVEIEVSPKGIIVFKCKA